MKTIIKRCITSLAILLATVAPAAIPVTAYAQNNADDICAGVEFNVSATGCENDGTDEINNTLEDVINIFSIVVGIISVIMIIVGGLKYIMSGGDSSNVSGAKNTILYAIIGLVVVALAQVIVRYVLGKVGE